VQIALRLLASQFSQSLELSDGFDALRHRHEAERARERDEVAATVRAVSPTVPIVMLTGWGQRLVADDEVPPHVDRVLNKPPRLAELREILAELTA